MDTGTRGGWHVRRPIPRGEEEPMDDDRDYRAIAERFYTAFSTKDPNVLDLFADDYLEHSETPGIPTNREGAAQFLAMMYSAFSDLTWVMDDVVGAHGTAVGLARLTGRHTGDFMGIPATGNPIDVRVIDYVKLNAADQAREHWGVIDFPALMAQLGVAMPMPQGADIPAQQAAEQAPATPAST
jgi:steroid delta-isomerase-like uncharacterized protein